MTERFRQLGESCLFYPILVLLTFRVFARKIRIGTRGSPLALVQANRVRRSLEKRGHEAVIQVMSTRGDREVNTPLPEIGGKGLFTAELEASLAREDVDLCVHSMKDVGLELFPGTTISSVLPRADVRDVLILKNKPDPGHDFFEILKNLKTLGTSSLRRQGQALMINPNLQVTGFRGNLQTRLKKLYEGEVEATFLAKAGLDRLEIDPENTVLCDIESFLPACAQGAIGIQSRNSDFEMQEILKPLNCRKTEVEIQAERSFLAALEGNCRMPIAGLATIQENIFRFCGKVVSVFGLNSVEVSRELDLTQMSEDEVAEKTSKIGRDLGLELKQQLTSEFYAELDL